MGLIFTEETAKIAIEKNTLAIIDFGANWCGPCRTIEPIIEQLSEKYADKIIIGKVNVDDELELARKFNIMSIPTFVAIKEGKVIGTTVGVQTKQQILDLLK